MFLRKTALSCVVLCCVFSAFAQKQALSKIDIDDLTEHLTFLASDELQGRKLGTEVDGLEITARYLADHAKKIGLKPGANNYFQKVPMFSEKPDETNFISVLNTNKKLQIRSNYLVAIRGGTTAREIESDKIVMAGFGNAENKNAKGKIVVLAQGSAESFKKGNSFRWNSRLERDKISRYVAQQPEVIILVADPNDLENKTFAQINAWYNRGGYSLAVSDENEELPVLLTTPDFADELLGGKGAYKKYLGKVSKDPGSGSQIVKNKVVKLKTGKKTFLAEGKNVIGIVEGSDPVLKNEYVVFVAHYDHVGVAKNGDVYNGADDNGSGTVAIMEVAEAFASLEVKPKRTIVFLWVTCEEIGHLGSTYYCDHPIYPLEKTVAAINLDMVGRVYESPRDDVHKNSPKKVKDFDGLYTLSNDVWPQLAEINDAKCKELGLVPDTSLPKERFLRASDHYHFHKNGVPILNYATGYHADYHKVGDEVEKINFEKIKRVADLCFLLGYEVADLDKIEKTVIEP